VIRLKSTFLASGRGRTKVDVHEKNSQFFIKKPKRAENSRFVNHSDSKHAASNRKLLHFLLFYTFLFFADGVPPVHPALAPLFVQVFIEGVIR